MNIETAEIVLSCANLSKNLEFFTDELGFRVDSIFPADNPREAVISGFGLRLRLKQTEIEVNENIKIRLNCDSSQTGDPLVAPNGVRIEFSESDPSIMVPNLKPSLVINKISENADWIEGRAGMRYRDLIPDRQGGYVIASHIHIPDAGPVPDYVHFHKVQFQVIYCYKGWVKVVYEDQGEPFVMNAGDCVLQPPEIRHRVLECSENLEVVELSIPAEHITHADHEMTLPNGKIDRQREFNGQRFVRHIAEDGVWKPWRIEGFECRDTGIDDATKGFASVKVVRLAGDAISNQTLRQDSKFLFMFVLEGSLTLKIREDLLDWLNEGDSVVIPAGTNLTFCGCSKELEILEIELHL